MANSIIKEFPTYYELIYFNGGIPTGITGKKEKSENTNKEESLRTATSRARRMIKEYSLCNNFKYFVTFTLSEEITYKKFKYSLAKIIQNYNYRNNQSIKYVITFELGSKNNRLHAHGLMTDIPDKFINEHGYIDSKLLKKRFGFISAQEIKSIERASTYVSKYISKDTIKEGQSYICSKGLKTAEIVIKDTISPFSINKWDYENDHIKKKKIYKTDLERKEKICQYIKIKKTAHGLLDLEIIQKEVLEQN